MITRLIAAFALVLGTLACASPPPASEGELSRASAGVLYAVGANLADALEQYEFDEDEVREIARGLVDSALHKPYAAPTSPEVQTEMAAFREQRLQEIARREEQSGQPVLDAAAREPGAVRTESGMILRVIEKGSGPSPTIWDYVRVNYRGVLSDGSVFETNQGKEPWRVRLGTTLRCWQEAFGAVSAGARLQVVCPAALGYGWAGAPPLVKGGAVLTYDLELLSVEPAPEPKR